MRAVFKLEDHCSTCAVLVLVPVFHIVFPLLLSALWRLALRSQLFLRSARAPACASYIGPVLSAVLHILHTLWLVPCPVPPSLRSLHRIWARLGLKLLAGLLRHCHLYHTRCSH
jgi:hypothetical protein